MTTKLHPVSAHMRRSPVDPFAAIKAAKTEQALRDELERDETFLNHLGMV